MFNRACRSWSDFVMNQHLLSRTGNAGVRGPGCRTAPLAWHCGSGNGNHNPVVYGEYGTGEHLLLYNHYDVQPPEPLDQWDSPPLRRCSATTNSLLVAPQTTKENSSRGWPPSMRCERSMETCLIALFVEGEEEIGSPSLGDFVRTHKDRLAADACVWEGSITDDEGRFHMELGCRGIVDVELRVRTIKDDAHSGLYSYLPNAAWRLRLGSGDPQRSAGAHSPAGIVLGPPTTRQRELLAALPSQEEQEKTRHEITHLQATQRTGVARSSVLAHLYDQWTVGWLPG